MDHSASGDSGIGSSGVPSDRARVLLEINNAVVSQLDLAQVLNSVSACLRREMRHDFAALALYDPEKNQLVLHALDFPVERQFLERGQIIPLVGTPAALAFSSRKPVLRHRPDFEEFPADIMKKAYANGIRSGCAVPLICHDNIVGSMMVASLREAAFTEDDSQLMAQIASQVAIAVHNAQNFEKARKAQEQVTKERDRSELLLEINNAVVSHLDLGELLKSIFSILSDVVALDSAFISLCDSDGVHMRVRATEIGKLQDVAFREGLVIPIAGTPEQEAISTKKRLVISANDLSRFSSPWVGHAREHGVKSGCFLPLITHGRTLGVLGVVSLRDYAFSEADATLLEQMSGQIAIAVENSLNYEQSREAEREVSRQRDHSQLLLDINNALVSHLDLRELVKAISRSLQNLLQHDCVGLAVYDTESGKMFAQAVDSALEPMMEGIYYALEGTVSGFTFHSRKPEYIWPLNQDKFPSPVTKGFIDRGLKSLFAVPLVVGGRVLGVMSVSSVRDDAFTQQDQELIQEVGKQVSIAVANSLAVRDLEALKNKLAREKLYLEDEIRSEFNFDEVIGRSPALREVLRLVDTVAASDSTVLLLGETGTGKELIARAVHEHSRRESRTFVKLNCAAIPTGLLESELFGHEKGAFTGAIAQRVGRLELADQGTLFLDEVGDIPIEIQPKLLRAIQEREFERLGSTHTKRVNVRLVAATNRDLEKMIVERQFRSDLYYRLNVFPIRIPPLRERKEDIPLLARYFAEKFARQMQKPLELISSETTTRLQAWHWPGNIRELENLIERSVILSNGTALQVPFGEMKLLDPVLRVPVTSGARLEDADREHIIKVLRDTRGVLAGPNGAASRLGLKRTTLQYKIKKLGITRDQWWPSRPST